jgi:hypothetical protein
MRKLLAILVVLVVAATTAKAQDKPAPKDSIVFASVVHDYGALEQGGNGSCEFTFTNKGTTPLVLENVKASCGCTVPEWTRTPVAPDEKGTIKVTYNTNILGAFTKSITVNSNAINNPVILIIKGIVSQKK